MQLTVSDKIRAASPDDITVTQRRAACFLTSPPLPCLAAHPSAECTQLQRSSPSGPKVTLSGVPTVLQEHSRILPTLCRNHSTLLCGCASLLLLVFYFFSKKKSNTARSNLKLPKSFFKKLNIIRASVQHWNTNIVNNTLPTMYLSGLLTTNSCPSKCYPRWLIPQLSAGVLQWQK